MRIPDVNVLLYAYDEAAPQHPLARGWLEDALSSTETTGLAWVVLLGFIRIATQPAIYPNPLPVAAALDIVDQWLALPYSELVHPGTEQAAILRDLLMRAGVGGDLASDAHLAGIAIEHGATLASFDGDFHRFEGLKLEFLR